MFDFIFRNYLTRGFWGDEAWTSMISQLPYGQMLQTTAADFHPPAYYTIIELVYKILPHSEIMTRLVSILFYALTIWMVYLLAKKFKGRSFGLVSALVVALNPIFFTYAFEARNYTLFAFAATISCYFLLRLSQKFLTMDAFLFVLFSTLGIYTHYYMFFILAAQGFYLLLFDRKIFWKLIACYLVVGLLYLPWVPFLYKQVTSVSASYWISPIGNRTYFEAFQRILAGEQENVFKPFLFWSSSILLIVGIWHHVVRRKFEKPYLLIWLWAIVPFILASLPGLKIFDFKLPLRPIFFWRYLIGAAVPLSMVMVHAAQRFDPRLYKLSIAIIVGLSLLINFSTFTNYPPTFKQIYQQEIIPDIKPGDRIVTVLPSFAEVLYYRNYFGLKNEVIVLPDGLVQFSGKSLLDAYVKNGVITIAERPQGKYFELTPGPALEIITNTK